MLAHISKVYGGFASCSEKHVQEGYRKCVDDTVIPTVERKSLLPVCRVVRVSSTIGVLSPIAVNSILVPVETLKVGVFVHCELDGRVISNDSMSRRKYLHYQSAYYRRRG